MTRPKIYLIDGHALAYRAFYGLPSSMMTTDGQMTNAIYGFVKMMIGILDEYKPAALAVSFDLPQPTFRHVAYKEYKAHRPPSPLEFKTQVPFIKEIIKLLKIPIYEVPGFEADDVLGTMAEKSVHEGYDVVIVTGDRDALQLVNEHIHVLMPQKGISEIKEYDIKAVEEKYEGLKPRQIVDLKALMGDASDNIPGVAGIGEKTGLAIIKEFESIDKLLSNLAAVPREAIRKKLQENVEVVRQSYMLAEIKKDVPFDFSITACLVKVNELPWDQAMPILKKLQLNSLVKKYDKAEPEFVQTQGDLFSGSITETKVLDKTKVLQARLMKYLLNPDRQTSDEDVSENDIDSIPEYEKKLKEYALYKIYDEIELPLASILEDVKNNGVKIDVAFLAKMSKELEEFIKGLEHVIYKMAGEEFNINSPKQMSVIFFEKLKMPVVKKTKTGYSTDASVLEELSYEFDIAKKILEYRQLAKLKSTYVDALPLLVDPKTGKLHTSFNQTATATGRLSSSEPNLQNIPIRTEMGRKVRQAFIPEKEGNILLAADYSQIELRILAHMADETNMIAAFAAGLDIHIATASQVFGVPLEEVTPAQRSQAKAVNFGIAYGMSARKLSRTVGIPYADAQKFIDGYFEKYPGIKRYIDETILFAKKNGYVSTLLGRRRFFPDITSPNKQLAAMAERAAINMPIQGTSADFIKIAMIRVAEELIHSKMKAKMILQVHDELVFDLPESEAYDLECMVKKIMSSVYELKVPLLVNVSTGKNWLEAK